MKKTRELGRKGERDVRDFTAILRPTDEDGEPAFEATFKEFGEGVVGYGETPNKALSRLYGETRFFIDSLVESGKRIPEPQPRREWEAFSGKLTLRVPKSLHCKLHLLAEDEGVSLNSMVTSILSWGAEMKHCQVRPILPMNMDNRSIVINVGLPSERMPHLTWGPIQVHAKSYLTTHRDEKATKAIAGQEHP